MLKITVSDRRKILVIKGIAGVFKKMKIDKYLRKHSAGFATKAV
jgi:hypothetical protein